MRLGDLDALKEAFAEYGEKAKFTQGACQQLINNAPTIIKAEYIEQYIEGLIDGRNRPQGEWEESHIFSCGKILLTRMDVIEHKCSHCGRWSIKWFRTIPDNFCSHCGADMRGDKE